MRLFIVGAPTRSYQLWNAYQVAVGWDTPPSGLIPIAGKDVVVDVCVGPPRILAGMDRLASVDGDTWLHGDWQELPPVPLREACQEAELATPRLPAVLEGRAASAFLRVVERLRSDPPPVFADHDGKAKDRRARDRSNAIRQRKLMDTAGLCPCCGHDYAALLPEGAALAALQVHHLHPLSAADPDAGVVTTLDDVIVVCASCHALLHHADPAATLPPEALATRLRQAPNFGIVAPPAPAITVPEPDATWDALWQLALSFDGYRRHGTCRPALVGNGLRRSWAEEHTFPDDLDLETARLALFFEQRRYHHFGQAPTGDDETYVRALVGKIRTMSGGKVMRDEPVL